MKKFEAAQHGGHLLKLLPVALAILLSDIAFAEPVPDAYRVMVISDQAYGEMLLAGNYEDAIAGIEARERRVSRFATSNNLCAAYTVTKNVILAKSACNTAVRLSRRTPRDRAVALTNRGVLNALIGDEAAAREDFEEAIRFRARIRQPVDNLARLESRSIPVASL